MAWPAASGLLGTGAALTAGQTWEIDIEGNDDIILTLEDTSGGANTLTIDAGDYPQSPKAAQGADTQPLVASDVIPFIPEKGRHIQSDGKMTGSLSAAGRIWAFRAPPGFVGIVPMNP